MLFRLISNHSSQMCTLSVSKMALCRTTRLGLKFTEQLLYILFEPFTNGIKAWGGYTPNHNYNE